MRSTVTKRRHITHSQLTLKDPQESKSYQARSRGLSTTIIHYLLHTGFTSANATLANTHPPRHISLCYHPCSKGKNLLNPLRNPLSRINASALDNLRNFLWQIRILVSLGFSPKEATLLLGRRSG